MNIFPHMWKLFLWQFQLSSFSALNCHAVRLKGVENEWTNELVILNTAQLFYIN